MNYTFFGGNNVINDISRDAIKSMFEVAAWTHSKRVTTRYYRQDSRSVGANGERRIQCAFAIVEMLFREIERISRCLVSDLDRLKQEKTF